MSEKEREAAATSQQANPTYPNTNVMTPPSHPPTILGSCLQDTTYWKVVTPVTPPHIAGTVVPQGAVVRPPKAKSLLEAYLLGLPLGFLGAHHFYLGRPAFGIMYLLSFGLLGCGWLIDLLRMPCLVAHVNKANRERYEQLQSLQQQLQQQHLQHEQQLGSAAAAGSPLMQQNVAFVAFEPRSLVDAYILWFPCGLLGYHHFYLRNWGLGILYHLTLGLLGIGWLVDLFRMPSLVREANAPRLQKEAKRYGQCTAHVLALSPAGILGGHHFYLNRPLWGCLYACTLGLLGTGWVYDWFRTSYLVKRANAIQQGVTSPRLKHLDDAYILCIPFGFTGLHHFYLHRFGWGILYFLTLGTFGIGWLIDWFRLPWLVKEHNASLELTEPLVSPGRGNGGAVIAGTANQTQVLVTSPVYPPAAGYGYYQTTYPGVGYLGGTYPGYMNQGHMDQGYLGQGYMGHCKGQAGAGVLPPPRYDDSTAPGSSPSQASTNQGDAPPSYEASLHDKRADTIH